MGNVSSNPTKKLDMLVKETNDFSANVTNNIVAEARQNVIVSQVQNIVFKDAEFKRCKFKSTQTANIVAEQTATFKAVLSNPKKMLKNLTEGPKSIFGQAFASNSSVMKDFLATARASFGANDNTKLRQELTNVIKININQNMIAKATQNIQVSQTQNVLLSNFKCEDSTVEINQNAAIEAMQNVMVQVVMDALSSNPNFRQAIRQFNGDYDPKILQEQVDAGVKLPQACIADLVPIPRQQECPAPEPCPPCQNLTKPFECKAVPSYDDYILSAKLFYSAMGISVLLIILAIILKR